jgi:hypothetical protein
LGAAGSGHADVLAVLVSLKLRTAVILAALHRLDEGGAAWLHNSAGAVQLSQCYGSGIYGNKAGTARGENQGRSLVGGMHITVIVVFEV